ncbi:AKAP7 2'5' RNA ligase-like domain-containing protein [Aspergillus egyptiacus]|nr:AKAP7 2'5' RNA ligase-like domain-containing protein [Aspergillus egyptiacus]
MSEKKTRTNHPNKNANRARPKRPPLTHFLCLPLVNEVSLPQLESSLAAFKASIPSFSHAKQNQDESQAQPQQPLIPDDAIRPLGTLHLTLGVMSLPTAERLEEALLFFHSLDLVAMMRKAEESAALKRLRADVRSADESSITTDSSVPDESTTPEPFSISLESLHALPRARSATVLHAAPVDPTSRLYPFCDMLRNKFLESGFLQGEYKKEPEKTKQDGDPEKQCQPNRNDQETNRRAGEEPAILEELSGKPAEEAIQESVTTDPSQSRTAERKGQQKPRPLLLHATVANTIYVRGRKRNGGGRGGKSNRSTQYTFDAREILSQYKNYYLDVDRTVPRLGGTTARPAPRGDDAANCDAQESPLEKGANAAAADEEVGEVSLTNEKSPSYPFVWARDIPIESVCICEMGAKKLDPAADESGMNARLREKYAVVAERSLNFRGRIPKEIEA